MMYLKNCNMTFFYCSCTYCIYRISEIDYVQAIKVEFEKVVKLQEELGIDVLVHGEAEVKTY